MLGSTGCGRTRVVPLYRDRSGVASAGSGRQAQLRPDALTETVALAAPPAGEGGDDGQAAAVDRVGIGSPDHRARLGRRRRSPGPRRSRGRRQRRHARPRRTTLPGSGCACRIALPTSSATTETASASSSGSDRGRHRPTPRSGLTGGARVVRHHHTPCALCHRRRHWLSLPGPQVSARQSHLGDRAAGFTWT